MANQRILLTLSGVFLAGVATGMVGMRYGLHEWLHPESPVRAQAPAGNPETLLARYQTELALTPDQTEKLKVILNDWLSFYEHVQEEMNDAHIPEQVDDLRATGKSRVMEILTPAQRQKFEKMNGLEPTPPVAQQ